MMTKWNSKCSDLFTNFLRKFFKELSLYGDRFGELDIETSRVNVDFLKVLRFSFPVSCSWPPREGLLSPAARQIYRRNFPPVGFIQSRTVLLMHRQSNPITPHETCLELF